MKTVAIRPSCAPVGRRLFREDLYYRLKVVELKLPKLSERRQDITLPAKRWNKSARFLP